MLVRSLGNVRFDSFELATKSCLSNYQLCFDVGFPIFRKIPETKISVYLFFTSHIFLFPSAFINETKLHYTEAIYPCNLVIQILPDHFFLTPILSLSFIVTKQRLNAKT